MANKTCGECKYFEPDEIAAICEKKRWICDDNSTACNRFEPKVVANGDSLRQMSSEGKLSAEQIQSYVSSEEAKMYEG